MKIVEWLQSHFPIFEIAREKAPKFVKTGKTEHVEQREFVAWFRRHYPNVLILAIPNGGARHAVVAAKLKLEGVVSGIPDLYIPEWSLWIEMKAIGGRTSDEQEAAMWYLRKRCGHTCLVAYGCEHARSLILSLRP